MPARWAFFCARVPFFQRVEVLLEGNWVELQIKQASGTLIYILGYQLGLVKGLDIVNDSLVDDIIGQGVCEVTTSHKIDDGDKAFFGQVKKSHECFNVPVILSEWVLESIGSQRMFG
jgi:hypothetical protein